MIDLHLHYLSCLHKAREPVIFLCSGSNVCDWDLDRPHIRVTRHALERFEAVDAVFDILATRSRDILPATIN